jgi:hypothetical protein
MRAYNSAWLYTERGEEQSRADDAITQRLIQIGPSRTLHAYTTPTSIMINMAMGAAKAMILGIYSRISVNFSYLNHVQFGNRSSAPSINGTVWQTHSLISGGQDHGFQTGRGLNPVLF